MTSGKARRHTQIFAQLPDAAAEAPQTGGFDAMYVGVMGV